MKKSTKYLGKRFLNGSMAMVLMSSLSIFNLGYVANATTSNVSGSVNVSPASITCGKPTTVTMNLTGQAGITQNPVNVELVLDRSGSMQGTPIANLKIAASKFIDIIDKESDGLLNGVIGNGSHVGIVSFADTATAEAPLSSNANLLKSEINSLVAGGATNHASAFQTAQSQLGASSNKKIIMFTDGETTAGGDPNAAATIAKNAGIEIYSIGLGSANEAQLKNWASDPDSSHVRIAPTSEQLESIFGGIGAAIVTPAATNIALLAKVNPNFTVSALSATKGTFSPTGNNVNWNIASLGSETATLTYTITHNGVSDGDYPLFSEAVSYTDAQGQIVNFGNPVIHVSGCDTTPPVTTASLTPEDDCDLNGWYNKNVDVTFTATDDKSGVAKTEYRIIYNGGAAGVWNVYNGTPVHFTDEGSYVIQYKSTDNSGNVEVVKSVSFNIDKTAPTVNLTLDKTELWAPNHKMVPVNVTIDANDTNSGSGIKSIKLISITSNEPTNSLGDGNTAPDYQDAVMGTDDRAFSLRAERSGLGDGRVYTITYEVVDAACNKTVVTATVTVPHDQSDN